MIKLARITSVLMPIAILLVLAINIWAFAKIDQSSLEVRVATVEQKVTSHEKLDDERFDMVTKLDTSVDAAVQRLTAVEEGLKSANNRINSMIWWLRACFGALVTQIIGALAKLVVPGIKRR